MYCLVLFILFSPVPREDSSGIKPLAQKYPLIHSPFPFMPLQASVSPSLHSFFFLGIFFFLPSVLLLLKCLLCSH